MKKRMSFVLRAAWLAVALCFGLLMIQPVLAAGFTRGFAPQSYKSGYAYGNGVYFAPYRFTLYSQPSETAPTVGEIHWGRKSGSKSIQAVRPDGSPAEVYADRLFFCFMPELDVAMMAVIGENDQGWVEVVYDQSKKKTAWVRLKSQPVEATSTTERLAPLDTGEPEHFGVYQTWLEFMKLNAKASGIYWLSGVSEYQRSVRSSDDDKAKFIPITIMRDLKVKHIRGNWLLVEVLDFERNTPIGWVRWRDDDGNLMVFPNISGEHLPIVTTAY